MTELRNFEFWRIGKEPAGFEQFFRIGHCSEIIELGFNPI